MAKTGQGDAVPLPRYRCHKEVAALKIAAVAPRADGDAILSFDGWAPVRVSHDMVRRYMPVAGDYLVFYEPDGYRSISPCAAFEDSI